MDETTLTTTLRSLATEPVLHTAPSADARSRAHRLQRRRLGAAAGALCLVTAAVASTVASLRPGTPAGEAVGSTRWLGTLDDPTQPNHATTGFVTLPRTGGGQYAVYWQHQHLCLAFTTSLAPGSGGGSGCASVVPVAGQPMTQANVGGEDGVVAVSVATNVTKVVVQRPDGSHVAIAPVTATGFPYRAVVATGKVASLRAYDKNGHQLGDAVAGPEAVQLAQVKVQSLCAALDISPRPASILSDSAGKYCYQLEAAAMTLVPSSAQAEYDATQGYLVQVSLTPHDQPAFAQLTRRAAAQAKPENQLAVVWNGKVISVATIEQEIAGPEFQITAGADPAFTQAQAERLATELAG